MFLLATFPKVKTKKKKKKVLTQINKTHSPSLQITRSMGHTTRETYEKERYSQTERDRDREREKEKN